MRTECRTCGMDLICDKNAANHQCAACAAAEVAALVAEVQSKRLAIYEGVGY